MRTTADKAIDVALGFGELDAVLVRGFHLGERFCCSGCGGCETPNMSFQHFRRKTRSGGEKAMKSYPIHLTYTELKHHRGTVFDYDA